MSLEKEKIFKSENMNYIFNVEYFKNIFSQRQGKEIFVKTAEEDLKKRNKAIFNFKFAVESSPLAECEKHGFSLYTLYPGMLIGTGNPHEIAVAGALKCGFTFDYVTGLPYITGSTLKGMLRSYFPGDTKNEEVSKEYDNLIRGILGKEDSFDVLAFKDNMFENADVFLGAFPVVKENKKSLLDMEFITPHSDKFKNPNPISLVKVKPAVEFRFSFIFSDYVVDGGTLVSAEEKRNLCKELLLLMGIGAKTNVGFGKLSETKPQMHTLVPREMPRTNHNNNNNNTRTNNTRSDAPMCPVCNKKRCNFNKKTGKQK